ncbi:PREDICTED: 50S ribosomal L2 [Prunus dulcis]|uniref:PREDICTED: 50S ribosomal L2 n=1 Tax=Prunus dulcis TaxID=3755 RepID=A0A5E4G579_PRUDU|nr:PREDICTED: 50S ribosomal L2 [Prunus dulcis]
MCRGALAQISINSQLGRCMPLGAMHIGAKIHNIEMRPGQGGKLWIDSKCRATIGSVPSGPNSGNQHKNRRPKVRGVAMNPIDHPHGGG